METDFRLDPDPYKTNTDPKHWSSHNPLISRPSPPQEVHKYQYCMYSYRRCVGEERGCVCGGGGRCWEGVVEGKFWIPPGMGNIDNNFHIWCVNLHRKILPTISQHLCMYIPVPHIQYRYTLLKISVEKMTVAIIKGSILYNNNSQGNMTLKSYVWGFLLTKSSYFVFIKNIFSKRIRYR